LGALVGCMFVGGWLLHRHLLWRLLVCSQPHWMQERQCQGYAAVCRMMPWKCHTLEGGFSSDKIQHP
jgi:hypothetical protein